MRINKPPIGRKRGKGCVAANPKSITAAERVKSYANEYFTARGNVLFCSACREVVALKNVLFSCM